MNSTARYDFNLVKIFMVDFQATKAQNTKNLPKTNEILICFQQKFSQRCSDKEDGKFWCVTWMGNGSLQEDAANVHKNSDPER